MYLLPRNLKDSRDRWVMLYFLNHGHRNAPWEHEDAAVFSEDLDATYYRTSLSVIKSLARHALPDAVIECIKTVMWRNTTTETAISWSRVSLQSSIRFIAETTKLNIVEGLENKDDIRHNSLLVIHLSEHQDNKSMLRHVKSLCFSVEVMFVYVQSGVCFSWRFVWDPMNYSFVRSVIPEIPYCNLGLVPTRLQLNALIVKNLSLAELKGLYKWEEKIDYKQQVDTGEQLNELFKKVQQHECKGERGAEFFRACFLRMLDYLIKAYSERHDKGMFEGFAYYNVFRYYNENMTIRDWGLMFGSLCEIAYFSSSIRAINHQESLKDVVGSLIDPTGEYDKMIDVRLYPYSMTVVANVVHHWLKNKRPNRVITTSQVYYESDKLVKYLLIPEGVPLEYTSRLADANAENDDVLMIITELHPHNPDSEKHHPQDVTAQTMRLLNNMKKDQHLVVIVDITMDFYTDQHIHHMLTSLRPFVDQGKLDLYFSQSCAKLIQMGTDLYPGGMYIHFGSECLPKQEPGQTIKSLEVYLSWFIKCFSKELAEYCRIVRHNNQIMFNKLRASLVDSGLLLTPNTDIHSAYFSFRLRNVQERCTQDYLHVLFDLISEMAQDKEVELYDRRSFGFFLTNANVQEKTIRISCGLEKEGQINKIASILTEIGDVLGFLSEQIRFTRNNLYSIRCLLHEVLVCKRLGFRIRLTAQVTVNELTGETEDLPSVLAMRKSNLEFSYSHMGEVNKCSQKISQYESQCLYILHRLGLSHKIKPAIDCRMITTSVFKKGVCFIMSRPYIEQMLPLSSAKIMQNTTSRMIVLELPKNDGENLLVHKEKKLVEANTIYVSSDQIYVQSCDTGSLWVPSSGLPKDDLKILYDRLCEFEFVVERKSAQEYRVLITSNRRFCRLSYLKRTPLSMKDVIAFARDMSLYPNVNFNDDTSLFQSAFIKKINQWRWNDKSIMAIQKEGKVESLCRQSFVMQYLYNPRNTFHKAFKEILKTTHLSYDFFSWFDHCIKELKNNIFCREKRINFMRTVLKHLGGSTLGDYLIRSSIFQSLRTFSELNGCFRHLFMVIQEQLVLSIIEDLKTSFNDTAITMMQLYLENSLDEKYNTMIMHRFKSCADRHKLYQIQCIYDVSEMEHQMAEPDVDIIVSSKALPRLRLFIEEADVGAPPRDSRWYNILSSQ